MYELNCCVIENIREKQFDFRFQRRRCSKHSDEVPKLNNRSRVEYDEDKL